MTFTSAAHVSVDDHPLDAAYAAQCKARLDADGALILENFLTPEALAILQADAETVSDEAYFCTQSHNIYLTEANADGDGLHSRQHVSSKGCVPHDQVPAASPLRKIYGCPQFRDFLAGVLGHPVYDYADTLASLNIHFFNDGQELGWHYDNSSFAITLMVQQPTAGGEFEYISNCRDSDAGTEDTKQVTRLLDGDLKPDCLNMPAGTLVMFRGRDSLHRVTPAVGPRQRILITLAYNSEPGVSLSENARMMFFGRLD